MQKNFKLDLSQIKNKNFISKSFINQTAFLEDDTIIKASHDISQDFMSDNLKNKVRNAFNIATPHPFNAENDEIDEKKFENND